jgi:hypothetical protein
MSDDGPWGWQATVRKSKDRLPSLILRGRSADLPFRCRLSSRDFMGDAKSQTSASSDSGASYCAGIIEFTPFTAIEVRDVSKPVWGLNT